MDLPSAIIFINSDLIDVTLSYLRRQLFIDEVMTDEEFDERISSDPNYPNNIHGQNLRILVVISNLINYNNRDLADVIMFFNQGQINIEKNKFGPPGLSFPILRLNIWELLRGAGSNEVPTLATTPRTITECDCGPTYGVGGIVSIELRDSGRTICRNPDNIYNNTAFINRK